MTFLEIVRDLSERESKTQGERLMKLLEEAGELAVEVGIHHKISGFKHKKVGKDGIKGEAIDVILVALSIFFKAGGSLDDLSSLALKKCERWRAHQENI